MRATETVKLHEPVYKKLSALVMLIRRHGWVVVGLNRSDTPTNATVIAVAIDGLKARLEEKRGQKEE